MRTYRSQPGRTGWLSEIEPNGPHHDARTWRSSAGGWSSSAIIIGCETGTYLIDRIALAVFTVEIVAIGLLVLMIYLRRRRVAVREARA
ncbi:hypothetical protein [Nonomuraea sp. NPDC003709]|uniref:hypothetical protein n=1 Tax=Nonomuraea sp. NPDC003709 TaxID=3154450 RepID=UPI0033A34706